MKKISNEPLILFFENKDIITWKKMLLHEFVHACYFTYTKLMNSQVNRREHAWLIEGIAIELSHQNSNDSFKLDITFEELFQNPFYYNYSSLFHYCLMEYGKDYIFQLINENGLIERESQRLFEEAKDYYMKEKRFK